MSMEEKTTIIWAGEYEDTRIVAIVKGVGDIPTAYNAFCKAHNVPPKPRISIAGEEGMRAWAEYRTALYEAKRNTKYALFQDFFVGWLVDKRGFVEVHPDEFDMGIL